MFSYLGIDNPVSRILPCSRQQRQKLPSDEYFSNNAPIIAVLKENNFILWYFMKNIFSEKKQGWCAFWALVYYHKTQRKPSEGWGGSPRCKQMGGYRQFSLHPPLWQSPRAPLTIPPHPYVCLSHRGRITLPPYRCRHTHGHKHGGVQHSCLTLSALPSPWAHVTRRLPKSRSMATRAYHAHSFHSCLSPIEALGDGDSGWILIPINKDHTYWARRMCWLRAQPLKPDGLGVI